VNDFDDLDVLERELGPSLRVALQGAASRITDEPRRAQGLRPDAVDVVPVLQVVRTRSIDAPPIEVPPATATRGHRWRTLAAVAAAVLLLAVGTVVVVARDDPALETSVAALPGARAEGASADGAEELARAFLGAYAAFDADRAKALLTPSALAAEWGSPAEFRRELELLQATGYQQTILDPSPHARPGSDGCDAYDFVAHKETLSSGRLIVYCTYVYNELRADAIRRGPFGGGPFGEAYWAFVVDHGRIVSAENRVPKRNDYDGNVWRQFRSWVSSAYPQDAAAMYRGEQREHWKRTAESVRLWDQHTREYVAIGAPYIERAEKICAAARARFLNSVDPAPTFDSIESYTEYLKAVAPFLQEVLVELRAVPPPEPFRAEFERAYAGGDALVQAFRGGELPDPGNGASFTGQPGLRECNFDPFR
jgi:hypothetical protein